MKRNSDAKGPSNLGGALGFAANPWAAADKLREHVDYAHYGTFLADCVTCRYKWLRIICI